MSSSRRPHPSRNRRGPAPGWRPSSASVSPALEEEHLASRPARAGRPRRTRQDEGGNGRSAFTRGKGRSLDTSGDHLGDPSQPRGEDAVREPLESHQGGPRWDSPKTLIAAFVLVLGVLGLVQPVHAWWVQQREYRSLVSQIETTRQKNQDLQAQLDRWSSKDYVASQARARLQMVMPGETQYTVVDPGDHAAPAPAAQAVQESGPPRPWYLRVADSVDAADDTDSVKVLQPSVVPKKNSEGNQ